MDLRRTGLFGQQEQPVQHLQSYLALLATGQDEEGSGLQTLDTNRNHSESLKLPENAEGGGELKQNHPFALHVVPR
jgi:hypothetical protein